MVRAVVALGITQIIGWGTTVYALGVLAKPITADTGWRFDLVVGGFTSGLLASALVSASVGRLIDRHGGRRLMTLGSAAMALALAAVALAPGPAAYLAAWAMLGVAMRLSLYDAAFAALVQVTPTRGRTAISYLTLYGAFASSIFWTVGHYLNQWVGWRQTLIVFAAINLVVCLPLNWFGLARREDAQPTAAATRAHTAASPEGPVLEGRLRTIGVILFALIMSLNGFVFGVISQQLVSLLEASGMAAAAAVWVASLKGFAQFGGRVVEIVFGRNLKAITVARIAIGVLPFSLVLLLAAAGNFAAILAFTLLMGASQGVITIVRGAVPLALFGTKGYGSILGVIATPILIVGAAAPTVFALMVDGLGWHTSQIVLLGCATLSWIAIELMSRWYAATQRRAAATTAAPSTA